MTDEDEAAAEADTRARGHRTSPRSFGLGRIALRQLRSRPALSIAQGLTLAAAVTLLASVALIQSTTTDNGLRSALSAGARTQESTVVIERDGISAVSDFDAFQREAAVRVNLQL